MTTLQELAERIRPCREIVFFTGAGISTESGVPDFRSPGGIWTKYTPVYYSDFIESEEARIRYWKMKKETHELYKNVQPNIGHYSIQAFEKRGQLLGYFGTEEILETIRGDFTPPICDSCGGYLKPATISFGQQMPVEAMKRAQSLCETAEVFIVVGSSLQVQPAASFPVLAKRTGTYLAIINRDPTPLDPLADYTYRGAIGEFFKELSPLVVDA
jgi:NAD-dependent deacetylase